MNKFKCGLLVAAALSASSPFAQQEPNYLPANGQELADLIRDCTTSDCMSYVSGVINGINTYAYLTEIPTPFCAEPTISSEVIRSAIVGVVQDTPRLGRATPPAAILTAFSRNWPCSTSSAEAVSNNIDSVDQAEDLITYSDLDKVNMEALLDFVSKQTSVLELGNKDAPLEKTLHVFDDPNCEYCNVLTDELEVLEDNDWRILIYPIATVSEASKGYAAVQYAVRQSETGAPLALYMNADDGVNDISKAMQVAQDAGMNPSEILQAVASTNPYAAIEENTETFKALGATTEPSWILGDRISGIVDAAEIMRLQTTMTPKVEALPEDDIASQDVRPGLVGAE